MAISIVGFWESPYKDQLYTFSSDGAWRYEATDGTVQSGVYSVTGDPDTGYILNRAITGSGNDVGNDVGNGDTELSWGVDVKGDRLLLNAFDEAGEYPFYRRKV